MDGFIELAQSRPGTPLCLHVHLLHERFPHPISKRMDVLQLRRSANFFRLVPHRRPCDQHRQSEAVMQHVPRICGRHCTMICTLECAHPCTTGVRNVLVSLLRPPISNRTGPRMSTCLPSTVLITQPGTSPLRCLHQQLLLPAGRQVHVPAGQVQGRAGCVRGGSEDRRTGLGDHAQQGDVLHVPQAVRQVRARVRDGRYSIRKYSHSV